MSVYQQQQKRRLAILKALRNYGELTAEEMAEELNVSARTIYRDIADMRAQGVPVEGVAGQGYRFRSGPEDVVVGLSFDDSVLAGREIRVALSVAQARTHRVGERGHVDQLAGLARVLTTLRASIPAPLVGLFDAEVSR